MAEQTFGGDQTTPSNVPDAQGSFTAPDGNVDENQLSADQLAALQNRDTHAQAHITTLETENEKFRTELVSLAEKVDKLGDVDSIMEKLNRAETYTVDEASLIEKARAGVVESLASERAEQLRVDNFKNVSETLVAHYGDKTDEMVKTACDKHGMSWDSMVALAKDNPKAALSLCKVETKVAPQGTTPSSINYQGLQQQQAPSVDGRVGYDYAVNITERQRIQMFMERMAKGA